VPNQRISQKNNAERDRARKRRAKGLVGIVRVKQFTTLDVDRLPAALSVRRASSASASRAAVRYSRLDCRVSQAGSRCSRRPKLQAAYIEAATLLDPRLAGGAEGAVGSKQTRSNSVRRHLRKCQLSKVGIGRGRNDSLCRSEPHMSDALIWSTTSRGPADGSGKSDSVKFRSPRITTPFIASPSEPARISNHSPAHAESRRRPLQKPTRGPRRPNPCPQVQAPSWIDFKKSFAVARSPVIRAVLIRRFGNR
jgi:hypothetical protein